VRRLGALFAVDAFAGGFVVQAFLVFWFARRYGASIELMGEVSRFSRRSVARTSESAPGAPQVR
jgi:hypothetical protein